MANEAIVLQDKEGHYYVIPKETLEDARVADESKAVVDEDLGEVSGFALGAIIFVGGISPVLGADWQRVPPERRLALRHACQRRQRLLTVSTGTG